MKNCWPDPADPDVLFGAVVLACGPVPKKGWSKARTDGSVVYTQVRGKDARAFTARVLAFFEDTISEEYHWANWSDTHRKRLAQRWKNLFFRWLWSQLYDDSSTEKSRCADGAGESDVSRRDCTSKHPDVP